MSTIESVIRNLPTKVVNSSGNNFYLVLEMGENNTFRVFYRNEYKNETTTRHTFYISEEKIQGKVYDVIQELHDRNFKIFSPKIDEEFGAEMRRITM